MKEQRGHPDPLSDGYHADARRGAGFVDAHVHLKDIRCLDTIVDAGIIAVRDAGLKSRARPVIGIIDRPACGPCRCFRGMGAL